MSAVAASAAPDAKSAALPVTCICNETEHQAAVACSAIDGKCQQTDSKILLYSKGSRLITWCCGSCCSMVRVL
jgi:hypothetical protein